MSEKGPFVAPELGPLNLRPPKAWAKSADDHWQAHPWYEAPRGDPSLPEVYTYTDAMSYDPGDEVVLHTSTTAPELDPRGLSRRLPASNHSQD